MFSYTRKSSTPIAQKAKSFISVWKTPELTQEKTTGGGESSVKREGSLESSSSSSAADTFSTNSSPSMTSSSSSHAPAFNDLITSDVRIEIQDRHGEVHSSLHLHSEVLREQSEYFFGLLTRKVTARDPAGNSDAFTALAIKANENVTDIDAYISIFRLFYQDEDEIPEEIKCLGSVWRVLDILVVAWELQFHSCTSACVEYLESVPWNDDEQSEILRLLTKLKIEDAKSILDRLPVRTWDEETISDSLRMLLIRAVSFHEEMTGVVECREAAATILRNRHAPMLTLRAKKQVLRETFVDLLQCLWSEQHKKLSFRRSHTTMMRQPRAPLSRTRSLGVESMSKAEAEETGKAFAIENGIAEEGETKQVASSVYGKDGAMTWLVGLMFEFSMADEVFKWLATDQEFVGELKESQKRQAEGLEGGSLFIVRRAILGVMGAIVAKRLVVNPELRSSFARLWLPVLMEICQTIDGTFKINGIDLDSEERAIILFGFNELVLTVPAVDQTTIYSTWYQQESKPRDKQVESWFSLSTAYKRWLTRLGLPCSSTSFDV